MYGRIRWRKGMVLPGNILREGKGERVRSAYF